MKATEVTWSGWAGRSWRSRGSCRRCSGTARSAAAVKNWKPNISWAQTWSPTNISAHNLLSRERDGPECDGPQGIGPVRSPETCWAVGRPCRGPWPYLPPEISCRRRRPPWLTTHCNVSTFSSTRIKMCNRFPLFFPQRKGCDDTPLPEPSDFYIFVTISIGDPVVHRDSKGKKKRKKQLWLDYLFETSWSVLIHLSDWNTLAL